MLTLWTDPNPIQTGVYNDINVQANFSNSGGGYLQVSINGNQVVNYQGPLGYGQGTYWEYGIYRSTATETAAVDYRNMTLVTGSQATGWTGVGGTTSSGSTTQPTTPTTSPRPPHRTNHAHDRNDPTTPTTPTSSVTKPVLTVADDSLWVAGRGGTVDLGINVTTTDPTIS